MNTYKYIVDGQGTVRTHNLSGYTIPVPAHHADGIERLAEYTADGHACDIAAVYHPVEGWKMETPTRAVFLIAFGDASIAVFRDIRVINAIKFEVYTVLERND